MPFRLDDVEISWLGHAAFFITYRDTRYYIDPFKIKAKGPADVVLITHEHFDHLSIDDLKKIVKSDTEIVAPEQCRENLRTYKMGVLRLVKPGESLNVKNARVETIPAYNVNKFRAPGVVYHPKEQEGVGYILEVGGLRIYHAGDTDFIPEMESLKVDVALVPVSGTFVMTAEEAANAVNTFKPRVAIPMHFGAIVGDRSNAETFKKLVKVDVVVLEKE